MDEDEGVTVNVVFREYQQQWNLCPAGWVERVEAYHNVTDIQRTDGWLVLVHGEDLDTTSINLRDVHRIEVR
jgi:hypothetical protein